MKPAELIEALSRPGAYPHPFDDFEVHQTHISVVFLVGDFAYKVKKPVELGFLDFTTLEKRLHFCREEVRLNRRLAPGVYLGVVPITTTDSALRVADASLGPDAEAGSGGALEYAVRMRRLPPAARLLARLERGELEARHLETLAERLASFHAGADSGERVSRFGRFDVVAGNARENLEQARPHVGETISEPVFARLSERTESALARLHDLIEARAERDVPRDTHGDLHLDHVYLFPDREPPGDLVVIDCIEFNERFRYADPVADAAFLVMDLLHHRRPDLARAFADAYFEAAADAEGRRLLPFYVAYRAAVRGKVEGMITEEVEVPADERREAVGRARAHWLLSLAQLEEPERRPCLVLVGGLPGTGKSTLAEALAGEAGFRVLSSDRTRKELAGLAPETPAPAGFGEGLYTPEWNDRTYAELARRAEQALFEGERVAVDASFREEARRRELLAVAERLRVPAFLILCEAPEETVLRRLAAREAGRAGGPGGPASRERGGATGASDADREIYRRAAARWEPPGPETARATLTVDTGGSRETALARALSALREAGLAE